MLSMFSTFGVSNKFMLKSVLPHSLPKMLVAGAGGAGVNMVGGGRAFSYEMDGMSMDDERY